MLEIESDGTLYSDEVLDIKAKKLINKEKGKILSKNALNINSEEVAENVGTIQGENELSVSTKKLKTTENSKILSSKKLNIEASEIESDGTLYSDEVLDIKTKI